MLRQTKVASMRGANDREEETGIVEDWEMRSSVVKRRLM